jgi:hypothetical protein
LEDPRQKLEPNFKGVLDSLKWPLKEQETNQNVSRLERHKTLFAIALTADHM